MAILKFIREGILLLAVLFVLILIFLACFYHRITPANIKFNNIAMQLTSPAVTNNFNFQYA